MSDVQQPADFFTNAPGYSPPQMPVSNQDQAAFAAAIEAAVSAKLAQMGVQQAVPAREPTPVERAQRALANAGAGLGVDERLAELYHALGVLAAKVGL